MTKAELDQVSDAAILEAVRRWLAEDVPTNNKPSDRGDVEMLRRHVEQADEDEE